MRWSQILAEIAMLPTPPAFDAPVRGWDPRRNTAMKFGMEN